MSRQGSRYTQSVSERQYSSQQAPVSPQYVNGFPNQQYRNPTYESHVLPGPDSPAKVANRENTSYKEQFQPYNFKRDRGQSKRRTGAEESRSQLGQDDNKSRSTVRTRSSRQLNEIPANRLHEVTQQAPLLQPAPVAPERRQSEPQVVTQAVERRPSERSVEKVSHHTRTQSSAQGKQVGHRTPRQNRLYYNVENSEYVRSKKKGDDYFYQNPTFKSQILNSVEKVKSNIYQQSRWETTTRQALEMPFALKNEATKVQHQPAQHPEDYKPWRRQVPSPGGSPKKYPNMQQPYEEVPSPHRKPTHQPDQELKQHYFQLPGKEETEHARDLNFRYRKDDLIFPHKVEYEGDHNVIIHEDDPMKLYESNPVYRQIIDPRVHYTNESMRRTKANKILAEERRNRESAEKARVLSEEKNHLRRLAELEDREMRENERRRDYRMQIEDYHKILGEERLDLTAKQKANNNREAIKEEAEIVRHIGEEERRRKFRQMDQYNHDLQVQVTNKNRQYTHDDLVDDNEYHKHTGMPLGEYQEPSKEQLLKTLKMQVENKKKKYDRLAPLESKNAAHGGDWIGRKDLIDQWNWNYIHDHRRKKMDHPKDNTQLMEMKELAIRENARKRREENKNKLNDINLVNDLVANEREQRYQEYARNKQKTEILQNAYQTQMKEREIQQQLERAERQKDAKGTSLINGDFDRFGNMNYDYREDIQNNNERKVTTYEKYKNQDHKIVENLDNYDREMVHNERERKRMQTEQLNREYNSEMARLERERQASIEAKKHRRPVVYGKDAPPVEYMNYDIPGYN